MKKVTSSSKNKLYNKNKMLREFGFLSFQDRIEFDGIERSRIGRPFGRLANTNQLHLQHDAHPFYNVCN
jgi:hypothetical protein